MKIESVVVCVDFGDLLCWSLPLNKNHFNNMIIVTASHDKLTQKICEYQNVKCLVTDVCYKDGADFNKGSMIQAGLEELDGDAWVCHSDADIIFPPLLRPTLENIAMPPDCLFTMDRLLCESFESWLEFWMKPVVSSENDIFVIPQPFKVGTRIAKKAYGGWTPLGYTQIWNQGLMQLSYPTEHTNAGRSDILFSLNFPRERRHLLAELFCIHIENKGASKFGQPMGADWYGRKSPLFRPNVFDFSSSPAPSGVGALSPYEEEAA